MEQKRPSGHKDFYWYITSKTYLANLSTVGWMIKIQCIVKQNIY